MLAVGIQVHLCGYAVADAAYVEAVANTHGLRQAGLLPTFHLVKLLAHFRTLRDERRRLGWKGLLKHRGWTFVVLFVLAYLVRDLVLYVLVPLAIAAGLWR